MTQASDEVLDRHMVTRREAWDASARAWLKHSTEETHERLDRGMSALDLTDPDHYRRFLLVTARALPAVEEAIEALGIETVLPDWSERKRDEPLMRDLGGMDAAVPPATAPRAPAIGDEALDRARAMGMAYVLEGSRLGGRLLEARAAKSGSDLVRANMRYLTHGRDARLWQSFLPVLEATVRSDEERAAARQGAEDAFAAFLRALETDAAGRAALPV